MLTPSGAIGTTLACAATLASVVIVTLKLMTLGARWSAFAIVLLEAVVLIGTMLAWALSAISSFIAALVVLPLIGAIALIPAERVVLATGGPVSVEALIDAVVAFERRLQEQPHLDEDEVESRLQQIRAVAPLQARRFVRLLAQLTRYNVLGVAVSDIDELRREYGLEHERVTGWWRAASR